MSPSESKRVKYTKPFQGELTNIMLGNKHASPSEPKIVITALPMRVQVSTSESNTGDAKENTG